jgi:hypothetical protein
MEATMSRVERRLRALEYVFVAWFVAQGVLGTWVAYRVLKDMQDTLLVVALQGPTLGIAMTSAVLAEAALLALGIVLFQSLLRFRRCARLVLLVLAWISAASALIGLAGEPVLPHGMQALSGASLLANGLSLAFWAWTIHVLQFDAQVREAFTAAAG